MPMRRQLATAAILVGLTGCSTAVDLKVPPSALAKTAAGMHIPELGKTTSDVKLTTGQKGSPTAASALAGSLTIPADVSVRLPASLLDTKSMGVISNDGSTVISNDGSTVISNDGSTVISNDGGTLGNKAGGSLALKDAGGFGLGPQTGFGLLDLHSPAKDVAAFFHRMVATYADGVTLANLFLGAAKDVDNQSELLLGKRIPVMLPNFKDGGLLDLQLELTKSADQKALVNVYLNNAKPELVMQLTFTDKDHGTAVIHLIKGMPLASTGLVFTSTFDRIKNKAEVDMYGDHFDGYGAMRTHISISRPDPLVKGGPTLQIRVATAQADSVEPSAPIGQIEATAYSLADGSSVAIFGVRAFDDAKPTPTFIRDDAVSPDVPQAFFINAEGNAGPVTTALKSVVPPLEDVFKPYMPNPTGANLGASDVFAFKN